MKKGWVQYYSHGPKTRHNQDLHVNCCVGISFRPPSSPLSWLLAHHTENRAVLVLSVIITETPPDLVLQRQTMKC